MNSGLLLMTFSMSCRLLVVCNLHVKLQISISFKSVFMMGELLELLFFLVTLLRCRVNDGERREFKAF